MITAEPDCIVEQLTAEDEFLIVACDGIWDVLSNQQAVDFVHGQLARDPTMALSKIAEAMFDRCISDDPKQTGGIGGDNMTCVVVSLR